MTPALLKCKNMKQLNKCYLGLGKIDRTDLLTQQVMEVIITQKHSPKTNTEGNRPEKLSSCSSDWWLQCEGNYMPHISGARQKRLK